MHNYIMKERRIFENISQAEYNKRSEIALVHQPIRKEVSLQDIEVPREGVLVYKGNSLSLAEAAFKDLCKIVGLPIGFEKSFTKNFGEKARGMLISKLKIAAAAGKRHTVTLIVNPESKKIVAIHKSKNDLISHSAFLDTTTSLIDRYGLEVNNFTRNEDGSLIINTSSPDNHFGIEGLRDEDFFGGITFQNSLHGGFSVSPYLHRLVCSNGMIGNGFEETLKLGGLKPEMSEDFFVQLNQMAERKFKPMALEGMIKSAINTPASLYEMRGAYDLLCATSGYGAPGDKSLEEWIPYKETILAFNDAKIPTFDFSDEQMKRAKTGTSIWDVVNGLTHFGTHDNGIKLTEDSRRKIQGNAGTLLTKKVFDMQNTVRSPF